jgi:hypothetical protein
VLDNGKHNARELMSRVAGVLSESAPGCTVDVLRKTTASVAAGPELIELLAMTADLVLTGTGDCGSCTTWSVHDAIALERARVPAVLFCTTPFVALAEAIASHEEQALRIAIVEHPSGGIDGEAVADRAAKVIPQVLAFVGADVA